jgi:glycosyltransferase involved in cell wall biosynthesis
MSRRYEIKAAVSVVVPAYNAARTLVATLERALAQTVRDIEVIVVDDGSTDPTVDVLRPLSNRDRRLRLIHTANRGVSAARNVGILAASADLIAFLDADDLWPLDHLATHLGRLVPAAPAIDVSFSAARFIDARGVVIGAATPRLTGITAEHLLSTNPTTTTSTWVVRRSAFATAGLFDVSLRHAEDQEWLVRAALSGLRIEGTDATRVDYRVATGGLASDLDRMHAGFEAMLSKVEQRAPHLVARSGPSARAAEELYLARHALRLGLGRQRAWRHIRGAFAHDPSHVWRAPRQVAGALAGTLLARGR